LIFNKKEEKKGGGWQKRAVEEMTQTVEKVGETVEKREQTVEGENGAKPVVSRVSAK